MLRQHLDRCRGRGSPAEDALAFQVLQQGVQAVSAGNAPHSGCPQRIAELRDHRPVQVTGGNTADVHPAAQTTGHRQHVDDRARGIAPPRQPGTVSLDEGPHPARLPAPSGHDPPPFPEHPAPTTEASARSRNYADPTVPGNPDPEAQGHGVHVTLHEPRHSSRIGIDRPPARHRDHRAARPRSRARRRGPRRRPNRAAGQQVLHPARRRSPACSAIVQQFLRGRSAIRPSTNSRAWRRGSARPNRPAIRPISPSNAPASGQGLGCGPRPPQDHPCRHKSR